MKTKKSKILKPIDYDVHLKYRCPICSQDHWLSYLEASTKNFKIVCFCGKVLKVRRVQDFKIKYEPPAEAKPSTPCTEREREKEAESEKTEMPLDVLQKTGTILVSYGFTKNEAEDLVKKSFSLKPTLDIKTLVKNTLEQLKNNEC